MASSDNVRYAHFSDRFAVIHAALLELAAILNRPKRDEVLVRAAGLGLDRALFPVLVAIGRFAPIGVVDLADRLGRDYTTVSRQISRLADSGLVSRTPDPADRRRHAAAPTERGRAMCARIDAARERLARAMLADWSAADLDELARLMPRLAASLDTVPATDVVEPDRPPA